MSDGFLQNPGVSNRLGYLIEWSVYYQKIFFLNGVIFSGGYFIFLWLSLYFSLSKEDLESSIADVWQCPKDVSGLAVIHYVVYLHPNWQNMSIYISLSKNFFLQQSERFDIGSI